ncbi:amino acid-binding protein [Fortiea sp. LEGE XX443]|uniref:amino acid-binding protein n=1 Tax=Fortiea sp. LEGE XX443 TaxID=1828611 RepID=UPI001881EFAC|nr:amino acid-binding protein [Fortiea sp. LEGE XX443]MBE9006842.1 amino acid-binding protein [Fortiea sp. LEGE XX443]
MYCQIQRQLTIALENYPGRLAAMSTVIANQNINIEAISLIDNIEQGLIRIVVSEPDKCKNLLISEGFYVIEADIIAVEITDVNGQLARLTQSLTRARINIEYTYGSSTRQEEKMHLILKVSDLDKAYQVIAAIEES